MSATSRCPRCNDSLMVCERHRDRSGDDCECGYGASVQCPDCFTFERLNAKFAEIRADGRMIYEIGEDDEVFG